MARPPLLHAGAVAALAGLLTLSGCSDDSQPEAAAGAPEHGPLTAMLDAATGDVGQEADARDDATIENLIAECMAAEGFDYTPLASPDAIFFTDEDYANADTEKWVAAHGYGMYKAMQAAEHAADGEATAEPVDPNAGYVASLSESEAAAYYLALYGDAAQTLPDEETGDPDYSWEDAGCTGAADHEVTGGADALTEFDQISTAIMDLYASVQTDPRLADVAAAWSDCMADKGYPGLTTPESAMESVGDSWDAIYHWDDPSFTEPSDEDVAEFRDLEIATATTDLACQQEVGWDTAMQEVQVALEESVLKDNKAAVDEYVAALESARG